MKPLRMRLRDPSIGELKRDSMVTKAAVKFVQSKGVQKPTHFEGSPEDVLLTKLGEGAAQKSGLSLTTPGRPSP